MQLKSIFAVIALFATSNVIAQSNLPACPDNVQSFEWHNCYGILLLDLQRLEGEFRYGKLNGPGKYFGKNERYEGEFRNDMANGRGIYYYSNGARYEGQFRDYKKEGRGIF